MDKNKTIRFPAFHKAFVELKGEMSNKEFAEKLGMSHATVGFYAAGERIPDAIGIASIAEICGVSADWLLGLSSVKERNADLQAICDYTHLSPEAVEVLRKVEGNGITALYVGFFANHILTHPDFSEFLEYAAWAALQENMMDYIETDERAQDDFFNMEFDALHDRAAENGFALVSMERAKALYMRIAADALDRITESVVDAVAEEHKKREADA